jgi:hypothetical protein
MVQDSFDVTNIVNDDVVKWELVKSNPSEDSYFWGLRES